MEKFGSEFTNEFKAYVDGLESNQSFLKLLAKRLHGWNETDYSRATAYRMCSLFYESVECMLRLLREGYLYQTSIILRSHVEATNLMVYFHYNPIELKNWAEGKEIKPSTVRKDLETINHDGQSLKSFGGLYSTLCDYAHNNSKAIRIHEHMMKHNAKSEEVKLVVESVLGNIFLCTARATFSLCQILYVSEGKCDLQIQKRFATIAKQLTILHEMAVETSP